MRLKEFLVKYISNDTLVRLVMPLGLEKGKMRYHTLSLKNNASLRNNEEIAYTDVVSVDSIIHSRDVFQSLFRNCEIYDSTIDYNVTGVKFERDAVTIAIKLPEIYVGDIVTPIGSSNDAGIYGCICSINSKGICQIRINNITREFIEVHEKFLLKIAQSDGQRLMDLEEEEYDEDYIPVL